MLPTEVESRYIIPDHMLYRKLRKLQTIAGYELRARGPATIVDEYLDTRGRALLRQGWACRLRSENGAWTVTLKGPKSIQGAIVSRPEIEISLPEGNADMNRWPSGELSSQVRELTGGIPLRQLLTIRQKRHRYSLLRGSTELALLSLDVVDTVAEGARQRSYMLECELLPEGALSDLERLNDVLISRFFLAPETRSKLQRALQLVEHSALPDEELPPPPSPTSLEELLRRYDVSAERATTVAAVAETLFDGLAPLHHLPETRKPVLRAGALLRDVGAALDRRHHHAVGRDILLGRSIEGLDSEEQHMVAAIVYLHSKRASSRRISEAFPETLPETTHADTLVLAAIVRMADALAGKDEQETRVCDILLLAGRPHILLAGSGINRNAARARARSDLWAMLFGLPPEWEQAPAPAPCRPLGLLRNRKGPGILPNDSVGAATAKILALHLEALLAHEAGTREGQDPEELHDMRVATRRLRSALRMLGAYTPAELSQTCAAGLRECAAVLGAVRDLDVAIENAQAFAATLGPDSANGLDILVARWQTERDGARQRLLAYLDSPAYAELVANLRALVEQAAGSTPAETGTIGAFAPLLLTVYRGMVLAYAPIVDQAPVELLHALRIDCKRLRYGFEFLGEVLPACETDVIAEVVALQDHLGKLHDATVAVQRLEAILADLPPDAESQQIQRYQDTQRQEGRQLQDAFPQAWARFMGAEIQAALDIVLGGY